MSFPRYPRYKDSEVEWLGEVPEHWQLKKIKHLVRSIEQGWSPQCEGFPAEAENEWGVLKVGCVNGGKFNPLENKLLPPDLKPIPSLAIVSNDLLISRANTRELVGSAAVAMKDYPNLMLCDKLYRLRLKPDLCCPRFLSYYLGAIPARGQIELGATGASASMVNIGQSIILELGIAASEVSEQIRIAAFLDRETAKIDGLVEEQRRLIELLKEKRQAVISHAVTQGLNPHAPTKSSGIEWLGNVPAQWEVKRLKHISPFMTVGIVVNPSTFVADEGFPFIYGGDIREGAIDWVNARRIDAASTEENAKTRLHAGDLLTVRVGAPGVTAVVPIECDGGNCASVMLIRQGDFNSQWLCYAMNTRVVRFQVEVVQYGAAQEQFNISHAVNFWIPTPPRAEQDEMVAFLSAEIAKFDTLSSEAQRAIDLLQERRTALISTAVTGQIDVRHLNEKLPA